MFRLLSALALTTAGTVALAACDGIAFGAPETFRDRADLPAGITAVRLDVRSGNVTVHGTDAEPSLRRTVRYQDDRPDAPTHRVEDGVLVLGACGSDCSVSYTVEVPAGLPVSGGASSGSVRLHDVGEVNVTTDTGSVELSGVTGPIRAKTSTGRIEGYALESGRITAETSNGRITLVPGTPADIRAETSNGDITVTLPGGRYRVSATTGNGDARITVPTGPSAEHGLDLTSGNGDITATTV